MVWVVATEKSLNRGRFWKKGRAPGKRFELLRCMAPVAFKATALPV